MTFMPLRYARNTTPLVRDRRVCRARHDRPRLGMVSDPAAYLRRVAVDREVARATFAQFIRTALDGARARGLNDAAREAATGLAASTWYRWRKGEWGREWPKIQQVIDFCKGLGIPEE